MKRGLVIIFLIILLVSSVLVFAADETGNASNSVSANKKINVDSVKSELKDAGTSFTDKLENAVNKEITIPSWLGGIGKILLGIDSSREIEVKEIVLRMAVIVIFFIMFVQLLSIMPFFNSGASRYLGAGIFALLMGISGAVTFVYLFFLDLGSFFGVLDKLRETSLLARIITTLGFIWAIFWLCILALGVSIISKIIKNHMDIEKAEQAGAESGIAVKALREFFNWAIKSDK